MSGLLPDNLVKAAKEADLVQLVESYGVKLAKAGKEYFGLCPFHSEDSPSFTVTPAKNLYCCHGCGAGGDSIKFVQDYESVSFREAVLRITGESDEAPSNPRPQRAPAPEAEPTWKPIIPAPESAPLPPDTVRRKIDGQWVGLTVSRRWSYVDADGNSVGYVCRFEVPGGGKEVIPQVWASNTETGECEWRWLSFPKPRPIYGLDILAANPDAQVLIVEGEKAADAGRAHFAELGVPLSKLVVVSWPGGGKAAKHVDWSPLKGRQVALWPDADQKSYPDRHECAGVIMPFLEQPGTGAMLDIWGSIHETADLVKLIMPPEGVPDGWDLGDSLPSGFDLLKHLKAASVDPSTLMQVNELGDAIEHSVLQLTEDATNEGAREGKVLGPMDQVPDVSSLESFWAHLPSHKYIFVSTGELWPSSSVNGHIGPWPQNPETNKPMKPSDWLDRHRAVQQMSWHPGRPMIVADEIVSGGGWSPRPGAQVFNLYRAPDRQFGNAEDVEFWLNHLKTIYPTDWFHILCWLAHRIQYPGKKINHALVLGGSPGIGKDTLLEPVKMGVGSWNWSEVSPHQIVNSRFNPWVQCIVARVSELRDLKEDRFGFYETMKVYIAAPPDTLCVNQKHVPEYYVPNVMGVIFTTNNRTDGLYLPAEDRRHYVAWSEADKEQFDEAYWKSLWDWVYRGGGWNVVEYLRTLDLSGFNCKAPPERTAAFWAIVHANNAPEDAELFAVLGEEAASPDAVVLEDIIAKARAVGLNGLAEDLSDRKARRSIPHKLARAGYIPAHNPDAKDGLWSVAGKRAAVYVKKSMTNADQIIAARNRAALLASR